MKTKSRLKSATCSVVVTHADGTVEDHGVVAHYEYRPWWRRWFWLARSVETINEIQIDSDGTETRTTTENVKVI